MISVSPKRTRSGLRALIRFLRGWAFRSKTEVFLLVYFIIFSSEFSGKGSSIIMKLSVSAISCLKSSISLIIFAAFAAWGIYTKSSPTLVPAGESFWLGYSIVNIYYKVIFNWVLLLLLLKIFTLCSLASCWTLLSATIIRFSKKMAFHPACSASTSGWVVQARNSSFSVFTVSYSE